MVRTTFIPSVLTILGRRRRNHTMSHKSDKDSEGSWEDDDYVNNYVAFNAYQDVPENSVADRVSNYVMTQFVTYSENP